MTLYKHNYSKKIHSQNISLIFYTDETQKLVLINFTTSLNTNNKIQALLQHSKIITKKSAQYKQSQKAYKNVIKILDTYFLGKAVNPISIINTNTLKLLGTPFQIKVWKELLNIEYGKTTTYMAITKKIKHPRAFRAVGTSVGKNPLPILIPCHRVLPKTSSKKIIIGKFTGGSHIKKALLIHEKVV